MSPQARIPLSALLVSRTMASYGSVVAVMMLMLMTFLISGCSTLFDAPSIIGVQITKPAVELDQQAVSQYVTDQGQNTLQSGINAAKPNASKPNATKPNDSIDLTGFSENASTGALGKGGAQYGCGSGKTTEDALSELRQRKGKGRAEATLLDGVANFDGGRFSLAKSQISFAFGHGLKEATDRAVANMYMAFSDCITSNPESCANEFRQMFVEWPSIRVTTMAPYPEKWASILGRESPKCSGRSDQQREKPGYSRATLLVSRTDDGGSVIALNIKPGGVIVFDGRAVGETPPIKVLKVDPGTHSVIVKSNAEKLFSADILVGSGERVEIRYGVR